MLNFNKKKSLIPYDQRSIALSGSLVADNFNLLIFPLSKSLVLFANVTLRGTYKNRVHYLHTLAIPNSRRIAS